MKKNLIITFDYELFLGKKSGTIANSVIKPTQFILEVLQRNNGKAIFFVDATWLLFLRKNSPSDLKTVAKQIKDIISQGSSVELHLHPQWINAYIKQDSIGFEPDFKYKLHSFKQEEIIDIFKTSIDLLESITLQKILCFRAGGFCIEPFQKIKQSFEIFKIKYDFSLVPGVYLRSGKIYDYDFTDAPNLPYYSFQESAMVPDIQGDFIELPLSTYNNNAFYRLFNNVLLRLKKDKIYGDGKGIQQELSFLSRLLSKRLGFSRTFLTFDQMSSVLFKYILNNHFRNTPMIVILSHPKTLSDESLLNLAYVSRSYNTMNTKDLTHFLKEQKYKID
jgi:hypothetical protein